MSTTSSIDATIPADNEKVDKAEMRANFNHAKTEINELYRKTREAWKIVIGDKSITTL